MSTIVKELRTFAAKVVLAEPVTRVEHIELLTRAADEIDWLRELLRLVSGAGNEGCKGGGCGCGKGSK